MLQAERQQQRPDGREHDELRPLDVALARRHRPLLFERRQQQHHHHRAHEHAHHVVRRGEREQIDDQQQIVVVRVARRLIVPTHDQPQNQGDREQAQCVHLLVDDRLIPYRERRRRDDGAGERGEAPRPQGGHERAQPALAHEEPAPGGDGARQRGEQVDALRIARHQRDQPPDVRHEHEQRIAGRMRDPEHVRRGDVFRCVPKLGGRRERQHVQHEGAERHDTGP